MDNKKLYIGLGVLAVAGVAFYMWKKNQPIKEEEKANLLGGGKNKKLLGNNFSNTVGLSKRLTSKEQASLNDFSGAIGRVSRVGLSTNVIQNTVSCAIKERDCYKAGCGQGKYCSNPKPATTTTATASGANGFNYNGTIRMVSPLNY